MGDDVTTTPVAVEEQALDYSFDQEIMVVKAAAPWGPDLIAAAERLNKWHRADVVNGDDASYSAKRSNSSTVVDGRVFPEMAEWEARVQTVLHQCVCAYKAIRPFMPARRDTGYELLRYQPGQQFGLHIDQIAGNATWGARILSALIYLNSDYHGGELVFPQQRRMIQPATGDLVLFPSCFLYPHASRMVTAGVKYAVVSWLI